MDGQVKNRLRLWLRSERALGLPAVGPISLAMEPAPSQLIQAQLPAVAPEPPQPRLPVQSPAQAPARGNLVSAAEDPAPPAWENLLPPPSQEAFTSPILSTEEKAARLAAMNESEVRGCTKCRLCEQRTHTVFGEGDPDAKIFFIGEGPGETEDRTGRPFVGRAGELLTKMIAGMGLKREQVFIANIVKCRPPNNREPAPDEVATCTPYLERQIEIVRPKVIITLGRPAAQYMLQTKNSMGRLRGNWQSWRGIKLMPTFHPAYILRNDTRETKAMVWSDLKAVMAELGMALPQSRAQS